MSDEALAKERATVDAITGMVRRARHTLQRRANAELVGLYWHIGRTLLDEEPDATTDDAAVAQLADDLRAAFPSMDGLTASNLVRMREFAAAWPFRNGIVQQPVGQLPWSHIVELLARLDDQELREWYAGKDVQHTWSRRELAGHIEDRLHERDGAAPRDFAAALRRIESDLAAELTSDPDVRGFLDATR